VKQHILITFTRQGSVLLVGILMINPITITLHHSTGFSEEDPLGMANEKWVTKNIVHFPTRIGLKEVNLDSSQSSTRASEDWDKN